MTRILIYIFIFVICLTSLKVLADEKTPLKADVIYKRYDGLKESDSESFCLSDYNFTIVASVNGKRYSVNEDGCTKIIFQEDFDNDGYTDVLLGQSYGGNVVPPTYTIVSYQGEGRFNTHPLGFYDWKEPSIIQEGSRWYFRGYSISMGAANTDTRNMLLEYRIIDGILQEKKGGQLASLFSLANFTSKEVMEKLKPVYGENPIYSWNFDFDQDEELETITCMLMAHWGYLIDCEILDPPYVYKVLEGTKYAQCKKFQVLDELENGMHKMVCENDILNLIRQPVSNSRYN